jgi:hypothetical protein
MSGKGRECTVEMRWSHGLNARDDSGRILAAALLSDLLGRYVELGVSSNRPACAHSLHALIRLYFG